MCWCKHYKQIDHVISKGLYIFVPPSLWSLHFNLSHTIIPATVIKAKICTENNGMDTFISLGDSICAAEMWNLSSTAPR